MKQFIAIFVAILYFSSSIVAQTPQYKCTKYSGTGTSPSNFGFTTIQVKLQSIFYGSDFPGIVGGNVSAIYLRVGRTYGYAAPAVYNNLSVKVGYTTDSFFNPGSTIYDTFKTGLTTILNTPSFTVQGSDTVGKWIKIPVDPQSGGFIYDPKNMLVVEVAMGPKPNNTGFDLMASNLPVSGTKPRTLGGHRDSLRSKGSSTSGTFLDLGIDLAAKAGVGSTSGNMQDVSVYPTKLSKGNVNVSLSSTQALRELSIAVYAANGAEVLRRSYGPQGTEFHTALDVSARHVRPAHPGRWRSSLPENIAGMTGTIPVM